METSTCSQPGIWLGLTEAAPDSALPAPWMVPSHNGVGFCGGKTPSVLGKS